MGTQVGVLGPVVIVDDLGCAKPVGGRAGRALSVLAMRFGRFVALETLSDALWPGGPPRSARKAVLNAVSELRALLGEGAIERAGGAYRLAVSCDVAESIAS